MLLMRGRAGPPKPAPHKPKEPLRTPVGTDIDEVLKWTESRTDLPYNTRRAHITSLRAVSRMILPNEYRFVGAVVDRLETTIRDRLAAHGLSDLTIDGYVKKARISAQQFAVRQRNDDKPTKLTHGLARCEIKDDVSFEYRINGTMVPDDVLTVTRHILNLITEEGG